MNRRFVALGISLTGILITLLIPTIAQASTPTPPGDWYADRSTSIGDLSVGVNVGTYSSNYCWFVGENDTAWTTKWEVVYEEGGGSTITVGPDLVADPGEIKQWIIPGVAQVHSLETRVHVDAFRLIGGSWIFQTTAHIGVYNPNTFDFRTRIGPHPSAGWQGC